MTPHDLFHAIRELCTSAVYLFSIREVSQAHGVLARCEQLLAENGYVTNAVFLRDMPADPSRLN
jgi:hypothetical protein